MKILHVLINYHPSVGGTQLLFKGISEKCIQQYKDKVEVITVDSYYGSHSKLYKPIRPLQETVNGVIIRRFSFLRAHKYWFSLLSKIIIKITGKTNNWLYETATGPVSYSLKRAMDNTEADVIAASSYGYLFMQYPLYRHKLKNPKPFVFQGAIHFADNEDHQVITNNTLECIKASDYYLANTQYEKDRLIKLGVDESMIVVTGVATDVAFFAKGKRAVYRDKLNIKDEDIVIGYIGRIETTKGIQVLIDAFLNAKNTNSQLKLIIAGYETNHVQQLKKYIESVNSIFTNDIMFVLNIEDYDKPHIFSSLDIFVLPSVNESFGIVFLEAWACKKPVIGTAIGAIKSVIADNVDGLLMQPHSVESLTEKILILASNKDLRDQLGNNGYNKTILNYSWDSVTKKYRDTYLLAIEKFNSIQKKTSLTKMK
jgi:glycosyltransferase involved in cell wall biosynthesis